MWKNCISTLTRTLTDSTLLTKPLLLREQIRTTFILKRRHVAPLHKKNLSPKKLRNRFYIYDLVKDTNTESPKPIDVILTTFVDGLGNIGEKVSVKPDYAYNRLLLPGLAVYATPENLEKYKHFSADLEKIQYSSPNALIVTNILSRVVLSVVMNKEHPWTIKPWHIKVSFRKCCYIVPEEAITLPEKLITGPDMNLENKEFFVTVTINKTEKVNVRCKLHHWSTEIAERIPHIHNFWEDEVEPIYPEFADVLKELPKKARKVENKV
ncbi:large ribosomal subunit protein bL9m isoform X1 [Euwallacea similis]|uniref:large ribosomal subunit protein bL9m isoform X1 n=1 Tax=Euwallacea similis TaxID=1736056 RepID=UPI00344BCBC9